MARELRGVSPSGTLYARIVNSSGLWWNGSAFESYSAANYGNYDIAMSEQGASNVYVADFPSAITVSGTYEYFIHRQAGASPAEGDLVVNTGKVEWTGVVASTVLADTLIRGVATTGTLYARLMNSSGLWWNGTTFEAYAAANYSTYAITMTEQGNSGVYIAAFPSAITTTGRYEYFVYKQSGASPAEGDLVSGTGVVNWDSALTFSGAPGSMTGAEFYAYLLRRGFKRTDKSTECYEAITDAIQEMRRRFMFDEAETEAVSTDTIAVLGDFKIDQASNLGMVLGVVIEDDDIGTPLDRINKSVYDDIYPSVNVESIRGYPKHYCLYAGQIYLGPIPDRTSYQYRVSYSQSAGTVVSTTSAVPFTALYRDVLADLVMSLLFDGLEEYEKAGFYRQKFESGFLFCTRRERKNSRAEHFNVRAVDC